MHSTRKNQAWQDWFMVVFWSLVIFATIPFARTLRETVARNAGHQMFLFIVIIFFITFAVLALNHIRKSPGSFFQNGRIWWLAGVLSIFAIYTYQLRENAEEALHFVEYGVLSVLLYRALSHDFHDATIYVLASLIGFFIGALDEGIQWITPGRVWALSDIFLNFTAVGLVQVAIWKGIRPPNVLLRFSLRGLVLSRNIALANVLFLGMCLVNTPARTHAYCQTFPSLGFIEAGGHVMAEYGFHYSEKGVGAFRSRLSLEQLTSNNQRRASHAARILMAEGSDENYAEFLRKYSPGNAPYLHELRVHLFRRDRYLRKAQALKHDSEEYRYRLTVAFYENLILEKYFGEPLKQSGKILGSKALALMGANLLPGYFYESPVSRHLITKFSERQVLIGFVLLSLLILFSEKIYLRFFRVRSTFDFQPGMAHSRTPA